MIKISDTCYVTSNDPKDETVEAIVCCENGQWVRINKESKILELLSKDKVDEIIEKVK